VGCCGENLKICRLHMLLQIVVIFVASLWLASMPIRAETSAVGIKVDQNFDHTRTKFPLEGAHQNVTCETCHAGAVFKGVPTACASCHNGDLSKGKSLDHPKTSNECANCHNNTNWAKVHVDHSKINNGCFTCHDNQVATGKNRDHVKSADVCETCHIVTTWHISKFDHTQTVEPCESCHDRLHATGKPFVHIRSSNECATCHVSTSWTIGTFDHTGVVDGCFTCHDGVSATGKSKGHLTTSNDCQNCHNTINWTSVKFDHTDPNVVGSACLDCHDGRRATGRAVTHYKTAADCGGCHTTMTWAPVPLASFDHGLALDPLDCYSCHTGQHLTVQGNSLGKTSNHIKSSNACEDCHSSLTSWTGAVFKHVNIVNGCVDCHNGTNATGRSNKHYSTTTDCETCHTDPNFKTWVPASFTHDKAVNVSNCFACHDGQHLTSTGTALGKTQTHIASSNNCSDCHASQTTWTGAIFNHANVTTACVSCHDGLQSISTGPIVGKSNQHMPTSNTCDVCHNTVNFVPRTGFDHAEISVTTCFSCHDGLQTISAAGKMVGKKQGHVTSGNNCEACHASFTTWKTSTFDHSVIGATPCATCHDGVSALGTKDAPAPGHLTFTATDCGSCHTNFISFKPSKFDHTFASQNCVTCHDGIRRVSTPKAMLGQNSFPNHIPTNGQACGACHTSYTTWKTTFNHVGAVGTCFSCHNGTIATGKLSISGKHILTSDTCENCHVNTTWAVTAAAFDHADPSVVGQSCVNCHNGNPITGKLSISGKHPVTSDNCAACHVTTNWTVASAKFDHTDPVVAGTACEACHNGTTATGKSGVHILTTNTCVSCHTTTNWLVAANRVDHTAVVGTCFSCHDKSHMTASFVPISGKSQTHLSTSNLCASCHTTTLWKPAVLPLDHSQVFGTCFSCHDGAKAMGRSNTHVKSSTDCVLCHNTIAWTGANVKFDHTDPLVVAATCVSCHNGSNPLAFGKINAPPPGHPPSSDDCSGCHNTIAFKPAHFDHTDPVVAAQPCSNCHDGAHPPAVGKPTGHIPTPPGSDCKDCHTTATFVTSMKPDHSQPGFAGNCFSCHNGTSAIGKTQTHFVTSNTCDLCHNTTLFKPANFDHSDAAVTGKPCVACHDGAPAHIPAQGKSSAPGGHLLTSNACENCHASFTTWVTAIKFPHDDPVVAATPCAACHDGNHAPAVGKLPTHFQSSADCGSCHVTTAWAVGIGRFNHADPVSAGVPCFTCHNGTKPPAVGKIQGHVASSNICGDCHSTIAWKPARFDHANVVPGTCFTCHNGTRATGKSNTHFATSNTCDNCHNSVKWVPALTPFNHADPVVSGARCYSCHSGAKPPAVTKSNKHIASTTACETCHVTSSWTVALNSVDHSQVIGACFSCHNGTFATPSRTITPKSQTHFATTNTCDACHTTTAWKPVAANAFDHTQAIGTCNACHDGTHAPAVGKTPTHIKSTALCDACHTTIAWKPVAANNVDHTQVIGTCFSCHNGTVATGKSQTHIKTTTSCDICHTTVNWTASTVDHTQVIGTCFSCHDSKIATGKTTFGKHFNTTNTCEACHTTKDTKIAVAANWLVTKTAFDHSQAIGTCASCHTTGAVPVGEVKSPTHFITTQACDICHTTTLWKPVLPYSHISPAYVAHSVSSGVTTCVSCHKQNNEKITYLQPGLFPDCASCHSDKYKPDPHNKYGNVRYTFTELRDCTGACHIYKDATMTTIQTNRATNTKHRSTRSSWN
jgi:Cytochrome c7 and related cytochrome c/Cytochrome c554 and c-prime